MKDLHWYFIGIGCLAFVLMAASCQEKPKSREIAIQPVVEEKPQSKLVFSAQVAGGFYPDDPARLKEMIQSYLDQASKKTKEIEGDLLGIVVPHAGYPYSGPVAAYAFSALRSRGFKRVVVLGPAHRRAFSKPALLDMDAYQTPLGEIPIDRVGVEKLQNTHAASIDSTKFVDEHALEVELPFLQVALGEFQLIPIMISEPNPQTTKQLAQALFQTFTANDTLFVASTDMSHDYPYAVANALDENALRLISSLDSQKLFDAYRTFQKVNADPQAIQVGKDGRPVPDCMQLCGLGPVLTLIELSKLFGKAQAVVLDRRNSGDVVGDKKGRIVGYSALAISLFENRVTATSQEHSTKSTDDLLSLDEKKELLSIARESIQIYLKAGRKKDFQTQSEKLKEPGAAFVTLKKHGELRGCIGYMEPADPLWMMIRDRAIDAAVHDTRFQPVALQELSDLEIEISILSPRVLVKDPQKEIVIGRDGVWLELGYSRGVFLPQVPVEQGWNTVEEYLDNLCRKTHIFKKGCWKSNEAKIMRYSALVFSENQ